MPEPTVTTGVDNLPEAGEWRGPRAFAALRHRDYAIFWTGFVISNIGSWMQNYAQGYLIYELTHSALYLGVTTAAGTLPMLFLTLPAGVIADRFSKRKVTMVTQTLMMLQAGALAFLTCTGLVEPWHIVALAVFGGSAVAVDIPARQAMTVELVGKEDLLNAVALNSSAFNGARVIGPSVAGVVTALAGVRFCYVVNTVSFLAVILGLALIRPTPSRRNPDGRSVWEQIKEGVLYSRRNAVIRDILIVTGMASIFGMQYATIMPAFAKDVLHVGPQGLGLLQSAAGFGALAGAISIAALGHLFRRGRLMIIGSVLAPIGLLAFASSSSLAVSVAVLIVAGFGMMLFMAVSNNVVQTAAPDGLLGRIIAVRSLVFLGLAPIGALQIGWLAQVAGPRVSLTASAIVTLVMAICFGLRSRAIRDVK